MWSFYGFNYNFTSLATKEYFLLNNYFLSSHYQTLWDRWLYKYSTNHRKMFKNLFKFTTVKKLSDTNFTSLALSKRNLWLSEQSSKIENVNFFQLENLLFFKQTKLFNEKLGPVSTHETITNLTHLNLLKFYEQSVNWLTKRFYFFNSTHSNLHLSTTQFKVGEQVASAFSSNFYDLFMNNTLKSLSIQNSEFSFTNKFQSNLKTKVPFNNNQTLTSLDIFYITDFATLWNNRSLQISTSVLNTDWFHSNEFLRIPYFINFFSLFPSNPTRLYLNNTNTFSFLAYDLLLDLSEQTLVTDLLKF